MTLEDLADMPLADLEAMAPDNPVLQEIMRRTFDASSRDELTVSKFQSAL